VTFSKLAAIRKHAQERTQRIVTHASTDVRVLKWRNVQFWWCFIQSRHVGLKTLEQIKHSGKSGDRGYNIWLQVTSWISYFVRGLIVCDLVHRITLLFPWKKKSVCTANVGMVSIMHQITIVIMAIHGDVTDGRGHKCSLSIVFLWNGRIHISFIEYIYWQYIFNSRKFQRASQENLRPQRVFEGEKRRQKNEGSDGMGASQLSWLWSHDRIEEHLTGIFLTVYHWEVKGECKGITDESLD
jgi:hypothetical protein